MPPDQVGAEDQRASALLTRRRFALLLSGGLVAAVAAGDAIRTGPRGPLSGRPPDRVRALPTPALSGQVALEAALARRHSVREFSAVAPSEAELGQLLWAAQGVTRPGGRRTAPSAGALYPLDVYAVTADRLLRYLPAGHRVQEWDLPADLRAALREAALDQPAVAAAPLVLVVTGTSARTVGRYGWRTSRFVTLEAGHCAQNVLLQAVALGLGAVPVGSLSEDAVSRVLGLPGGQTPYYLIPVGQPAGT